MMLAQVLPDPNHFSSIGWVVVILAALAFGANAVMDLVSRMRGDDSKPTQIEQPVQVQKIWPAASLAELRDAMKQTNDRIDRQQDQIEKINEILRVEIPQMERNIAAAGEARVAKIHDRINDVLSEVSNLEGRIDEALKTR